MSSFELASIFVHTHSGCDRHGLARHDVELAAVCEAPAQNLEEDVPALSNVVAPYKQQAQTFVRRSPWTRARLPQVKIDAGGRTGSDCRARPVAE